MLNINKTIDNGTLIYTLSGRLDTVTAPDLERSLQDELGDADGLILDFAGLEYISSAGLRVLLAAQKAMNGHGSMKLIHVSETIMEIFDVTGFSEILTIE